MRALTEEWIKAAGDDLMTIEAIMDNENLTHIVAFHAQQCIEKMFKAILEENQIDIPKVHKLKQLSNMLNSHGVSMDSALLDLLDQLYIDSRYPGDFGLLPNGKPTLENAKEFYSFALDMHQQIINRLSK